MYTGSWRRYQKRKAQEARAQKSTSRPDIVPVNILRSCGHTERIDLSYALSRDVEKWEATLTHFRQNVCNACCR